MAEQVLEAPKGAVANAPAAAPAAQPAAEPKAPARVSTVPTPRHKPQRISAKKALGLEASPRKMMEGEQKKARERVREGTKFTAELPEPVAETPSSKLQTPNPETPVTAPETPAAQPAQAAVTPAAAAKIIISGKEYTQEELEAKLKESEKPAATPAPAQAAALEEEAPAATQEPQLTPEQVKAKESEFVEGIVKSLDVTMTDEELDTILAGGKDAVSAFQTIRKRDMATAILEARKGIAAGLNPVMNEMFAALKPLVANHQDIQRYQVEQQFLTKHKDFAPHAPRAKQVAEELARRFPQQVSKMTVDQFIDEVARQTDNILTNEHKQWFPGGNGDWRGALKAAQAAAAQSTVTPPAPAPAQQPIAQPAAPAAARVVRAPAANVPVGASGAASPDWRKTVAGSMR